ncbi:MAG: M56 family metallopeptidase [Rikenellaceae bacterium]
MTVGTIGVYLLEVSILLILLYIFNKQLLGRETLHRLNRYLWLFVVVLSFILPFSVPLFVVSPKIGSSISMPVTYDLVAENIVLSEAVELNDSSDLLSGLLSILTAIYCIGVAVVLVQNIISHCMLLQMVLKRGFRLDCSKDIADIELLSKFREYESQLGVRSKVRYVVHEDDIAPFSWFNYVVISRSDTINNGRDIIYHELSHVAQHHSFDVLLLNIVTIVLWFNPASWLTKRAVQQVHEYCADESVLSLGINAKEYQLLLIRKAVGTRHYTISNSLNHSNLKNRITMMLKKKSPKRVAAKCLYAIPVAISMIVLFSSPALAKTANTITKAKVTNYFAESKIETTKVLISEREEREPSADSTKVVLKYANSVVEISSDSSGKHSYLTEKHTTDDVGESVSYYIGDDQVDEETFEALNPERFKVIQELRSKIEDSKMGSSTPEERPFLLSQVMPTFQGGDLLSFRDWVMSKLQYPEQDAKSGVQGTVNISFVIEKDGSINEVDLLKSPSDEMFEEVKRVVLSSSKMWTPAENEGEKVRVKYVLPVIFALNTSE